jgi:hypothetical protein
VIYTYPWWWHWLEGIPTSWASSYRLWFADYGWPGVVLPPDGWISPHAHGVAETWPDGWKICQYSAERSAERVPGVDACPVDRDCIRNEETLLELTTP